ncbi:hypothetical protein SDC9_32128 [bioreactor metagenome]|uniref:Uncharacterized protein n=1 Tax=bioreactor metagenome TaxID=1076179 RepID=A0A644V5R2_9ZZZZ|nr:hypothetical protein [Methanobrevibacter sp.]MEA4958057.1 hypothetical protein [Methanobrevibacter sp.]
MDKKGIMIVIGMFLILVLLVIVINNVFSNGIIRFVVTVLAAVIIGLVLRKTLYTNNKK